MEPNDFEKALAARRAYVAGDRFKQDVAAMIVAEESWRTEDDVNRAMCDEYMRARAQAQRGPLHKRGAILLDVMFDYRVAAPAGTPLDEMVKADMSQFTPNEISDMCHERRPLLNAKLAVMTNEYTDGLMDYDEFLKNAGLVALFAKNIDALLHEQTTLLEKARSLRKNRAQPQ